MKPDWRLLVKGRIAYIEHQEEFVAQQVWRFFFGGFEVFGGFGSWQTRLLCREGELDKQSKLNKWGGEVGEDFFGFNFCGNFLSVLLSSHIKRFSVSDMRFFGDSHGQNGARHCLSTTQTAHIPRVAVRF